MPTFNIGKRRDDLQEAVLLPEDWYQVELAQDPTQEKNRKWKDGGENLPADEIEGAGYNIKLRAVIVSEAPEEAGRSLFKYLSMPNPSDEGQYMNDGQPKADWKAGVIFDWVDAFSGTEDGEQVSLAKGMKGMVYVVQQVGLSGEMENSISMNVKPRAVEGSGGGGPAGFGSGPSFNPNEDVPF